MADFFRTYEEEFVKSIAIINKKIESIPVQTNHKKQLAFSEIKADLTECEKNLKLMDTEIAALPPQIKFQFLRKVRQYKKDFDSSRKSLHKSEEDYALQKSKQMLLGAQLDDTRESNQKDKLLKRGQELHQTNFKLKESVKVMHQNLQISNEVEMELHDHTGRLLQNKKKLGLIDIELNKGSRVIKKMMLRIKKNKFILFSVLAVIFLVIVIILGIHFSKKGSSSSSNSTGN